MNALRFFVVIFSFVAMAGGAHTWPLLDASRGFSEAHVTGMNSFTEVPLAEALGTPGWEWEAFDGEEGRPYGALDETAKGGAVVFLSWASSISTRVPGAGVLRIRHRGSGVSVTLDDVRGTVIRQPNDPEIEGTDSQIGVVYTPPGGALLAISTLWRSEVEFVEFIPRPSSLAATFDLPETTTISGAGQWVIVPDLDSGRYGVSYTADTDFAEGWFDIPVTGPAEVSIFYNSKGFRELRFFVGSEQLWDGAAEFSTSGAVGRSVIFEIPPGDHRVRVLGRHSSASYSSPWIRAIRITPLPGDGPLAAGMDHPGAWARSGAWAFSDDPMFGGGEVLRPLPPPNANMPPRAPSTSEHVVQGAVSGPGFVRFRTYAQPTADGTGALIRFRSNAHDSVSMRASEEFNGWHEHRVWFPPGEHWVRWILSGTEEQLSLTALDQFAFEPTEVLPLEAVFGDVSGVWSTDPNLPWVGIRKEGEEHPLIISPLIPATINFSGPGEPTYIALAVDEPGELRFNWLTGARERAEGTVWLDGEPTALKLTRANLETTFTLLVPHDAPVTIKWHFETRFADDWAAIRDVIWTPLPQVSLAEALDAPPEVTWTTSPERPFRGLPDPNARNGNSAQVGLLPGEETWLEATVEGSGLFDFWFRGVPGAFNDPRDLQWELFINGVKSHIFPRASSWPAQWVLGDGPHAIRLVFRNNTDDTRRAFIAVDDVSWEPLTGTAGGEGWTASHSEMVEGFADGGFEDGPQHVIPVATGQTRWIEKTVEGPGILHWKARLIRGATPGIQRRVLVNGVGHLPLDRGSGWTTHRLHLPQGVHSVRWMDEEVTLENMPYPTQSDSIWQVSAVTFTPGFSPLMQGLDDDAMVWLEVGEEAGSLLGAESAFDGEDAWALGETTLLYLCNTSEQGIKAEGMVHASLDPHSPSPWRRIFRWAPPGESVEWAREGSLTAGSPVSRVDRFEMRTVDLIPLHAAMDTDKEIGGRGWIGLADAGEAFDGIAAAWSYLGPWSSAHIVSLELEGAAGLRFRWRASGTGNLGLRVNGAWLPVPAAEADWREVEIEVQGPSLVEWVHARGPETRVDAHAEAWLDTLVVESRPERTISDIAGGESGLFFESVPGEADADAWRPIAFRDGGGVWQESVRGIPGEAMLQTTVTGPALVAFRTQFVPFSLPTSTVPASGSDFVGAQSVIIISPGLIVTERFLSVFVNGVERLRIPADEGEGWQEHLFRVPAGEHQVAWRLDKVEDLGLSANHVPEKQAWIPEVNLVSPRAHYESWADAFLGGIAARGPADDANDNGVINFLAYAYRLDPLDAASRPPEFFGRVRSIHPSLAAGGPLERLYLHIPRLPPLATAVLQSSTDLVHWEPDSHPVRSVPMLPWSPHNADRGDYDSGDHQVMVFVLHPEDPPTFYRILYDLPTEDN